MLHEVDDLGLVVEALAALKPRLLCQWLSGLMDCNLVYFYVIVLRKVLSVPCIMKVIF